MREIRCAEGSWCGKFGLRKVRGAEGSLSGKFVMPKVRSAENSWCGKFALRQVRVRKVRGAVRGECLYMFISTYICVLLYFIHIYI